ILEFANTVSLGDIEEVIGRQVEYNTAISNEGLSGVYGAQAGRVLLGTGQPADPRTRAKAAAAAGSDARMSGCPLPVVINSGSGNQGITITMPLVEYAKAYNISRERLFRALAAANLIAIHQKKYIGSLSAYCGAVSAACGAGAGIAYMLGGSYELVSRTITNTIATIGGMVCDGAKSSCAAKIASAVECALFAYELAKEGHVFQPGEGMVKSTVEETIKSIGRMGRVGMHETDIEILNIMLGK
ncbi:MAG: L-serine ammonia-lyase, iron-sulfur-dependent, subunit alpha, partial [Eubacteriales bacterium]|nr:L-serine ammonia-lyase, iron-sulfur-dependent, subunit alpha [Eubacteriales bacterium]